MCKDKTNGVSPDEMYHSDTAVLCWDVWRGSGGCRLGGFQLLQGVRNIRLRNDCISLKYATSAPAADLHDDAFRDPGTTQITSGSATQIVEEKPRHSGRFTCVRPCLAEIPYRFPIGAR